MKKTKKESGVSVISIVFYIVAVIFLGIAAFNIWQAYVTVQSYQAQYTLAISDILGIYFSSCAQYFAYSFLLYGMGVGLNKIAVLNTTLCACMDDSEDAAEAELEEIVLDESLLEEATEKTTD